MLAVLVMRKIVTHKRRNRNEFLNLSIDSDILILVHIIVVIIFSGLSLFFLGLAMTAQGQLCTFIFLMSETEQYAYSEVGWYNILCITVC